MYRYGPVGCWETAWTTSEFRSQVPTEHGPGIRSDSAALPFLPLDMAEVNIWYLRTRAHNDGIRANISTSIDKYMMLQKLKFRNFAQIQAGMSYRYSLESDSFRSVDFYLDNQ
eukprot:COSAG05_NODE_156_length_15696_cov_359.955440_21_plen_113_part_00